MYSHPNKTYSEFEASNNTTTDGKVLVDCRGGEYIEFNLSKINQPT